MLDREIAEAARIARQAGAILMEVYATDFSVAYKSEADPVTDADTQANAYIVAELRAAFPQDGIVAEENEDNSDAQRPGRGDELPHAAHPEQCRHPAVRGSAVRRLLSRHVHDEGEGGGGTRGLSRVRVGYGLV